MLNITKYNYHQKESYLADCIRNNIPEYMWIEPVRVYSEELIALLDDIQNTDEINIQTETTLWVKINFPDLKNRYGIAEFLISSVS